MINWWSVIRNGVWILALAIALAIISMAHYQAEREKVKIGSIISAPAVALALYLAGGVFCFGLGLAAAQWWEVILGIILMGLFFWGGIRLYILNR